MVALRRPISRLMPLPPQELRELIFKSIWGADCNLDALTRFLPPEFWKGLRLFRGPLRITWLRLPLHHQKMQLWKRILMGILLKISWNMHYV